MGGGHSGFSDKKNEYSKGFEVAKMYEEGIRDNDYETLIILDKDGKLLSEVLGNGDSVQMSEYDVEVSKDAITVHNHPDWILEDGRRVDGGCFSIDDLETMVDGNEYQMRASSRKFTFSLTRVGGGKKNSKDFPKAYEKFAMGDAYQKAVDFARGQIAKGHAYDTENDFCALAEVKMSLLARKWLKNHSKEYGYEYSERTRR